VFAAVDGDLAPQNLRQNGIKLIERAVVDLDVATTRTRFDQLDPRREGALQAQRQVTRGRRFLCFRRRGRAVCVFTFSADQVAVTSTFIGDTDGLLHVRFKRGNMPNEAYGQASHLKMHLENTLWTGSDITTSMVTYQLVYDVSFQGKPLIEPSALHLDLKDQAPLGQNVRVVNTTTSKTDKVYHLIAGRASTVRNHFNALRIDLEENGGSARKLTMEARAFDDAVAFRYVVPEQPSLHEFRLVKETTEFRTGKDPFIYALFLPNYRSMYESEFIKLSASSLANQGGIASSQLLGLPLLMEVPGVAWMAIDEADLHGTAGMYLMNLSGGWSSHGFESRLAPHVDDPNILVAGDLPYHSAWRVLIVGTEPGRLIESNALTRLNPESQIKDTSWIRPGKASWDWWSGSLGPDGKPSAH